MRAICRIVVAPLLSATIVLTGCARVAFYNNADLSGQETGVKFFTPKPYLLVQENGAKDKPLDVSIVWLPDLEHPIYAKPISGLGTSDLSLAFANGMLTSFGEKTDSKVPELITALAALGSTVAGGASGAGAAKKATDQTASTQSAQDTTALGKKVTDAGTAMKGAADATPQLDPSDKDKLLRAGDYATTAGSLLIGPRASANMASATQDLQKAIAQWKLFASGASSSPVVKQLVDTLAQQERAIENALRSLQGLASPRSAAGRAAPEPQASFALYEVLNANGVTSLRRIYVP